MEDKNRIEGDVKINSPIIKKLENFWYHYKIHTIAILFAVFALLVLLAQCAGKTDYDAHLLYAGTYEIKHTASGGNVAPYVTATSSLKRVCPDTDGDGVVNVSLLNLFVVNNEEAEALLAGNPELEINGALVGEDTERLSQNLVFGDYYVCLLSERLFREYDEKYEGKLFLPLAPYLQGGATPAMANERAVYISSLPFSSLPEICNLPSDTVLCLRAVSEVAGAMNKKESQRAFATAEEIVKSILAYE